MQTPLVAPGKKCMTRLMTQWSVKNKEEEAKDLKKNEKEQQEN